MDQATDSLARWRSNIYLISQLIQNDVSSTKVRSLRFIRCILIKPFSLQGAPVLEKRPICSIPAAQLRGRLH